MDWPILMLLYVLQGIVFGLVGGVQMLMIPRLTTSQHATLGLSGWAPAFKVFFAPFVDSVYWTTLGRRKTWVVGSQVCIAGLMWALAAVCNRDDVSLATITVGFGALTILACTQDIAVDSWGLQIPATTTARCALVGQALGTLAGDTLFLKLESAGVLTLSEFLSLLGLVFMGVTATILLFVPEEPDVDPADQSSVLVTYQNVICVSRLPAVRTLLICLLTLKMAFGPESLMKISLVNRGVVQKHNLSLLSRICDIVLPNVVKSGQQDTLEMALEAMKYRLVLMLVQYFLLCSIPWFIYDDGNIDGLFYLFMIVTQICQQLAVSTMAVVLSSFFHGITDRRIGATYTTLLHSCSNFGGLWPTYVVKRVVDKMSWMGCAVPAKGCVLYDPNVSECGSPCVFFDGLLLVTLLCCLSGVVWYLLAETSFLELDNLPPDAWQIVTDQDQQRNYGHLHYQ